MQRLPRLIPILMMAAAIVGCTTTATEVPPAEVPEIRPGILMGYLPLDAPLDTRTFVVPAPAADSARQALDDAVAQEMLGLHGTPRWELAIDDAHLAFPAAAETFSCALGMPITEQDTPALYMLLRRTLADLGLATYPSKNAYQRERPFMVNGRPTCTPEEEGMLRQDGSYPSGHTAIGWGWALILAELAPDRAEALLARGRAFGDSRMVCNVHWYSDVVAGREVAAAAVAKLHTDEAFLAAMAAAGKEITRQRQAEAAPVVDCLAEAEALAEPL